MAETALDAQPVTTSRARSAGAPRHSTWDHLLYALAFVGFLSVLAASWWLRPATSGLGTHTQLHLPPCGILLVFGKPCPSCGMTTAFAWMIRGQIPEAFRAQPAGVAVFLAGLVFWLCLPVAYLRRRPFADLVESRAFLPTVVGLIVVILAVWGLRLAGWR